MKLSILQFTINSNSHMLNVMDDVIEGAPVLLFAGIYLKYTVCLKLSNENTVFQWVPLWFPLHKAENEA